MSHKISSFIPQVSELKQGEEDICPEGNPSTESQNSGKVRKPSGQWKSPVQKDGAYTG